MKLKSLLLTTLVAGATLFSCSLNESGVDPSTDSSSDLNLAASGSHYSVSVSPTSGTTDTFVYTIRGSKPELSNFTISLGACITADDIADISVSGGNADFNFDLNGNATCFEVVDGEMYVKVDGFNGEENTVTITLNKTVKVGTVNYAAKGGQLCDLGTIAGPGDCAEDEEGCSMSQGYYFASPVSAGWGSATVGTVTISESEARSRFTKKSKTNAERAFFQAATIKLSSATVSPTASVWALVSQIDGMLVNLTSSDKELGRLAGEIGKWVDANHCE
jgi:hypothetical protein